MILGQMGADVIKIESLEGDAFRHFGFGFLGWNQGKRALSLDLASPEGREIIHGLVRRADIVVENLRPGRMRRFRPGLPIALGDQSAPHLYVGQRLRQSRPRT